MNEKLLLEGFPITSPRGFLGWANSILLEEGGRRIIIDTGGPGDRGVLLQRMREIHLDPEAVEFVVLTHLHFDHCLNIDLYPRARIVVSRAEYDYVARGEYRNRQDPGIVPYVLALLEPSRLVWAGDGMQVSSGVTTIHTPGHTPGSISVVYDAGSVRTIACGDLVKDASEYLRGPDAPAARESLRRVRAMARRLVPGHDRPFIIEGQSVRYEGARTVELSVLRDPASAPERVRWQFPPSEKR